MPDDDRCYRRFRPGSFAGNRASFPDEIRGIAGGVRRHQRNHRRQHLVRTASFQHLLHGTRMDDRRDRKLRRVHGHRLRVESHAKRIELDPNSPRFARWDCALWGTAVRSDLLWATMQDGAHRSFAGMTHPISSLGRIGHLRHSRRQRARKVKALNQIRVLSTKPFLNVCAELTNGPEQFINIGFLVVADGRVCCLVPDNPRYLQWTVML